MERDGLVQHLPYCGMGRKTWHRRNNWGSDQSSSIEPSGLFKLVKGIRNIEKAIQYSPGPRKQFEGENLKRNSLRK